jgi:hypothetical protein
VLRARHELRLGPQPLGWALGLAGATVHAILRRHGCSRLRPRSPREPIVRSERERPGELLHVDVKKLGRITVPGHRVTGDRHARSRGAGWQYVFAAIDDASRLGFAQIYPDETADSALGFLALDPTRLGNEVSVWNLRRQKVIQAADLGASSGALEVRFIKRRGVRRAFINTPGTGAVWLADDDDRDGVFEFQQVLGPQDGLVIPADMLLSYDTSTCT